MRGHCDLSDGKVIRGLLLAQPQVTTIVTEGGLPARLLLTSTQGNTMNMINNREPGRDVRARAGGGGPPKFGGAQRPQPARGKEKDRVVRQAGSARTWNAMRVEKVVVLFCRQVAPLAPL